MTAAILAMLGVSALTAAPGLPGETGPGRRLFRPEREHALSAAAAHRLPLRRQGRHVLHPQLPDELHRQRHRHHPPGPALCLPPAPAPDLLRRRGHRHPDEPPHLRRQPAPGRGHPGGHQLLQGLLHRPGPHRRDLLPGVAPGPAGHGGLSPGGLPHPLAGQAHPPRLAPDPGVQRPPLHRAPGEPHRPAHRQGLRPGGLRGTSAFSRPTGATSAPACSSTPSGSSRPPSWNSWAPWAWRASSSTAATRSSRAHPPRAPSSPSWRPCSCSTSPSRA